jgi:ZIP family zinc transporter
MIHNFPEGIATFVSGYQDTSLGISVALAIALHNIPEGIAIAMPIYYATKSRYKAIKYSFLSGMAEPLGALIAFLFLKPFINELILGIIFAIVSGIMLYISLDELIPSSRKYGYHRLSIASIFLGISIMPLTHLLLN